MQSDLLPLHWAVIDNDISTVKKIIQIGGDVNQRTKNGWSPLHWAAAKNGDLAMTKALLEMKADVRARDKDGWTPLHWAAAKSKNPAIVEALLDAGANARARTGGGQIPLDFIKKNQALENTQAYWKLNDLSYI